MKALHIIIILTAAAVFSSQFFQKKKTVVAEQNKSTPLAPKIEAAEVFNFELFSLEIENFIKQINEHRNTTTPNTTVCTYLVRLDMDILALINIHTLTQGSALFTY